MRKRHLVLPFLVLSIIFLVLQLRLFWRFSKTEEEIRLTNNEGYNAAYTAIQTFMEVCHTHGLPVFLIDPHVIKRLAMNKSLVTPCGERCLPVGCRYLCTDRPLTTWGIINKLWQPKLLEDFSRSDFLISESVESSFPMLSTSGDAGNEKSVPAHYVFEHREMQHFIHLVVFYQRTKDLFWHARLRNDPSVAVAAARTWQSSLQIGKLEGGYSSLDVVKVTLDRLRIRAPSHPIAFLRQISESEYVECDRTRAELFRTTYGKPDLDDAGRRFYESARQLLTTAKQVLDGLGVRFWISSGTCLGWFRQCDLIPYSKDVDIGVWIKDHDVDLIPAMENAGLDLIHRFGRIDDSYELSFTGGDVKLDVFFFYEDDDRAWNGGTQARTGKKFKYTFQKFRLCWTLFLDISVRVPCQTESYIRSNYGRNWFEPVKIWDWKTSPSNVEENGEWSESERKEVIQIFA